MTGLTYLSDDHMLLWLLSGEQTIELQLHNSPEGRVEMDKYHMVSSYMELIHQGTPGGMWRICCIDSSGENRQVMYPILWSSP